MLVLGVDPGSNITGYGLVRWHNNTMKYVASGCIRLSKDPMPVRLHQLNKAILQIITTYDPTEFAIEKVFVNKNVDSALKLGQARGAILCAMATKFDNNIAEYSPRLVKKAIVGYGAAEKNQMQLMVKSLLSLDDIPQVDAADALALAICHINSIGFLAKV
jgi:crossover junction endodeoxyribonuclease RuvC